jgi:flagellar biosynthesis protein FlhB
MAGEERTEAATPKKRAELRRRGQVAKSQDLTSMVVFVGVIVCIHSVGGASVGHLQNYMKGALSGMSDTSLSINTLNTHATQAAFLLLRTIGPFLLTAMLLGVLSCMLQTGFLIAPQAMKPDFTRLNPLSGVKRLVSGRGLVETVKACGKLAIISWIAYATISGGYAELLGTINQDVPTMLAAIGELLYRLALRIALFLLILAAADYGYQRWSFEKSIRMTKEEVKQESKQQEGSPLVKSRIRARMRQIARRRMMESVPTADVIITNPTHFAVALKYDPLTMGAPQVVAKGADILAQKIRDLAREHDVPIIENPPLARNLYKTVEIGREIPPELFGAVAEILAFVYQVNRRRGMAGARV